MMRHLVTGVLAVAALTACGGARDVPPPSAPTGPSGPSGPSGVVVPGTAPVEAVPSGETKTPKPRRSDAPATPVVNPTGSAVPATPPPLPPVPAWTAPVLQPGDVP
ncbi:hypothetical protein [Actinocorallia sp. A-T 12471]|uniref:hypothetical protein n=1 Tax=Actinocorallia sp. A-T 12471 TaxID=3089813 RepID=UPI0029CE0791|nr:hypothetical protein [Actinocorallia sp. A-T 12471]MDX6738661.1 hypothetical protein [Actinocorallia sp. A-T 12471]